MCRIWNKTSRNPTHINLQVMQPEGTFACTIRGIYRFQFTSVMPPRSVLGLTVQRLSNAKGQSDMPAKTRFNCLQGHYQHLKVVLCSTSAWKAYKITRQLEKVDAKTKSWWIWEKNRFPPEMPHPCERDISLVRTNTIPCTLLHLQQT